LTPNVALQLRRAIKFKLKEKDFLKGMLSRRQLQALVGHRREITSHFFRR
jgi:hypothetical protein